MKGVKRMYPKIMLPNGQLPRAIMTIELKSPVTGTEIIMAVKAMNGRSYIEQQLAYNDKLLYLVGAKSEDPTLNAVVMAGNPMNAEAPIFIDPDGGYTVVSVMDWDWPFQERFGINAPESAVSFVKGFRDTLEEALRMF